MQGPVTVLARALAPAGVPVVDVADAVRVADVAEAVPVVDVAEAVLVPVPLVLEPPLSVPLVLLRRRRRLKWHP